MMPAASNKVEQKTSLEAQDPLKLALVMLDKKVRNLDKRKVNKIRFLERSESA